MTIKNAITRAGGVSAVARELGISPVSVYEWLRENRLPSDRIIPLAQMSGWEYTPHMLNPTLYPNPSDGIPSQVQP